jgi:hypothetical protein
MEAAVNSPQPPAALDTGPGQGTIFCMVLIKGVCLDLGMCRWPLHAGVGCGIALSGVAFLTKDGIS